MLKPAEAQSLILERQGEVDVEKEEGELIEEFFGSQLSKLGYLEDHVKVFIPSDVAAKWLHWATNEKRSTIGAGRILSQWCREHKDGRLQISSRAAGRGFTGSAVRPP